jgi:hypothetical protein
VRDLAYASGKPSRESQSSSYKLPERKGNSFLLIRDKGTPLTITSGISRQSSDGMSKMKSAASQPGFRVRLADSR